jgi:hypothetical protein
MDFGKFVTVPRFHLSVELAQRVELDLAQCGLDRRVVLRGVIHEHARHGDGEVSVDESITPEMCPRVSRGRSLARRVGR